MKDWLVGLVGWLMGLVGWLMGLMGWLLGGRFKLGGFLNVIQFSFSEL